MIQHTGKPGVLLKAALQVLGLTELFTEAYAALALPQCSTSVSNSVYVCSRSKSAVPVVEPGENPESYAARAVQVSILTSSKQEAFLLGHLYRCKLPLHSLQVALS